MKNSSSEILTTDDLLFVKTFEHPLDATVKALLADVQRDHRCRNKCPVLEIKDSGGDCYLVVPRRRLRAIATRAEKAEAERFERKLLRIANKG